VGVGVSIIARREYCIAGYSEARDGGWCGRGEIISIVLN